MVSAGDQETQISGRQHAGFDSPLFGASAFYRPFEKTAISVSAARSVMPSYIYQPSDSRVRT